MSAPPPDLRRLEDPEAALSKEEIARLRSIYNAWLEERRLESRLSLPTPARLSLAAGASFILGLGLGTTHGSTSAGYRFRAENAHRLPSTPTGWYLYHKSKNYHMALGGLKEGVKMGSKMALWTGLFFWIEDTWDEMRGKQDALNTVLASATVAGGFSLWSKCTLDVCGSYDNFEDMPLHREDPVLESRSLAAGSKNGVSDEPKRCYGSPRMCRWARVSVAEILGRRKKALYEDEEYS